MPKYLKPLKLPFRPKLNEQTSTRPYDIGREDRIANNPMFVDKFWLENEQIAYEQGYSQEAQDLEFVLPYYTKLGK